MESPLDRALHAAWAANDTLAIVDLLRKGADPNARQNGVPLLMSACMAQRVDLVRALLSDGAEVDARNDEERATALMYVVSLGYSENHMQIRDLLLERGADVNARDVRGNSVMDLAIAYGNVRNAEILQAHGATCKRSSTVQLARMKAELNHIDRPRRER